MLLDIGLYVAVGEVGLQIRISLQIAVAGQHITRQPVAAVGAKLGKGIAALLLRPALQFGGGSLIEGAAGFVHLPKQQMQAGQQRLQSVLTAGLQPFAGRGDALGLALGKAGGGEGGARQKICSRRGFCPATEQIHLLLHCQEGTDLLKKGLKFLWAHARVTETLQSAPAGHQLFKQGQTLGPFRLSREVAAE